MNEALEAIQKELAGLTQLVKEKIDKGLSEEAKALSAKIEGLQKEFSTRKTQFELGAGSAPTLAKKELETRMDELYIAKTLCVNKDTGKLDEAKFAKITALPEYAEAIKAFGDVDASTTTTADSFIPTGFSTTAQEEIFLALQVAGLFGRINMPASDYKVPFVPGRLIAKATLEGGSPAKSKPGDERLTFTAKKIMSIVELTDELEADAMIPVLNLFRQQLINGFALAQDAMALNGDKGTVIYGAALDASDCRSLVNGVRADAMTKGIKIDASTGKCSVANIRKMRAAMGKYGVSPSELALIVSIADYMNLLNETNIQTLYQYGANAILLKGELGRIDGIPIIVSELIPDRSNGTDSADAPGGVLATGICDIGIVANNDFSTFSLVNRSGFMWGDRKEFSLEVWRNPLNQTNNLIGSQRLDFEKFTVASGTPSALAYNYAN